MRNALSPPIPNNQVILGDCCRVLADLPAGFADLVLTDPPYLVNYQDRSGRSIAGDIDAAWLKPAFAAIYRALAPDRVCVSFYGWNRTDLFFAAWKAAGFRIVGHITFPKRYASATRLMRYQHEGAYLLAKGSPAAPEHLIGDVIDWTGYSGNKLHPTQKPVGVLTPIVESFSRRGGLVLDPFAGSGSTCVAARLAGRRYLGIEVDPAFHGAAQRRLSGMAERMALALGLDRGHGSDMLANPPADRFAPAALH